MGEEIIKIFNKITTTISVIFTGITSVLGIEWVLFAGYLVLNFFDYLTGTIKAKIKRTESSSIGLLGIFKKVCYWILIGISFLISYLLVNLGSKLNINLEFIVLFGWFTLACLIINESRSIIENLIELDIYVPTFLKRGLEVYENIINSTIDKINNKK